MATLLALISPVELDESGQNSTETLLAAASRHASGCPCKKSIVLLPTFGGFLKWGYPQIIHVSGNFHYFNQPFCTPMAMETSIWVIGLWLSPWSAADHPNLFSSRVSNREVMGKIPVLYRPHMF